MWQPGISYGWSSGKRRLNGCVRKSRGKGSRNRTVHILLLFAFTVGTTTLSFLGLGRRV